MSGILRDMRAARGAPRDLTQQQIARLREQLNNSLYLFAQAIFDFPDLEPGFHGDLCAYIEAWGTPNYRRIITQQPRGSFKSSLGTCANASWQICREPDQPIVIFNETEDLPRSWLRAIRGVVEANELFYLVYGDLIPKGVSAHDKRHKSQSLRWNDSMLDLEGRRTGEFEASITAFSTGASATGHHWPKSIYDDIVGEKHKLSATEMHRAREWAKNAQNLERPVRGGQVYVNCTPWTFDDVYVDFTQKYGYVLYRRSALENAAGEPDIAGEPVLRIYHKPDLLRALEQDRSEFYSQLMCLPLPGGETSFDPSYRRWYTIDYDDYGRGTIEIEDGSYRPGDAPQRIPLSALRKEILFDPAPSEPGEIKRGPRSRNGIVVLGVDEYDRRFALEGVGLRLGPTDILDTLFRLAGKWEAGVVHIEEVNFSKLYRHWILQLQRDGNRPRLQPRPVKIRNTEKAKRILDLAPAFRDGQIYFNRRGCDDLDAEYLSWHPAAEQQDVIDALAHHREVHRPIGSSQAARIRQMEYRARREADITGYGPTCREE